MPRRFSGLSYRLYTSSSPVSATPITIAGWVRADDIVQGHALCTMSDTAGSQYVQVRTSTDTGRASISAKAGGAARTVEQPGFQANTWHHIAGVFASSTSRRVYLDGVSDDLQTLSAGPTGLNTIHIGTDYTGYYDNYTGHDLAHLAIWSVALTQAEILALKQGISPLQVNIGNLRFYAPLDRLGSGPDPIGGRIWSNNGAESLSLSTPRIFVPAPRQWTPETVAPPYHDETASGTIALPTPTVSGETGPYFLEGGDGRRFDGITYRLFTSSTPVTAAPITIAGWIRVDNTSSQHALACITNPGTASHYWVVRTNTSQGAVHATTRAGGTEATAVAGNVPVNTWTHIAGVFGAANSRLAYLNGIPGTANTTNRIPTSVTQINIGALRSGTTTSIATAHDCAHVAIWNVALTTNEILALAGAVYPPMIRPGNLRFYSALDVLGSPPDLSGGRSMSNDGAQALSVSSPRLIRPAVLNLSWAFTGPPPVTPVADAVIQREISASIQAAAVVQGAANWSTNTDAAVSETLTLAAIADTVIVAGTTASITADAAVRSEIPAAVAALEGAVRVDDIATVGDADLAVSISADVGGGADVAVVLQNTANGQANAAAVAEVAAQAGVDSAIQVQGAATAATDGAIVTAWSIITSADVSVGTGTQYSESAARRASIQAYSGGATTVVSFMDGLAGLGAPDRAHVAGAYRGIPYLAFVENEFQAVLDAAIVLQKTATATVDAIADAGQSALSDADAVVIAECSIQAGMDAGIAAVRSVVAALDAIVLAAGATLAEAAAAVTAQAALIATADAAASLARSIDTLADTVAAFAGECTVSPGALVEATRSITVGLDVLVQASGILVMLESAVLKAITLTGTADAAVLLGRTAAANAEVAAQVAMQAIASIDAATQATLEIAVNLAAAVSAQRTIAVTADTVVGSAAAGLVTALDAITEATISIVAAADSAAEQGGITASLSADVGLARYAFSTIEFDLVAAATLARSALADTAVGTSLSATTAVDALVFTFNPFLPPPLPPYLVEATISPREYDAPKESRTARVPMRDRTS